MPATGNRRHEVAGGWVVSARGLLATAQLERN